MTAAKEEEKKQAVQVKDSESSPLKLYVGCSGWSYSSWKGPFYPLDLEPAGWLRYYSNIFDYVEIDSSFYRMPNTYTVMNWYKRTTENFRFTAKFPKTITHDKRLKGVEEEIKYFFKSISALKDKVLALLIQLPPSIGVFEGLENLSDLIPLLDERYRYAVEVRNRSWFQDLAYNFFANNNMCMVWSQLAEIQTPPVVTTDFIYLRFIGDRSIDEKDFGRIQKDRVGEMEYWSKKLKQVHADQESANKVKLAVVAATNHYAGFGPSTANMFRKMAGLQEVQWNDASTAALRQQQKISDYRSSSKQKTLFDFSS